jgi:hypothetical protein
MNSLATRFIPSRGPERPVDAAHQPVHQRPEVLVSADVGAGRDRHLHQPHLLPEVRVRLQHPLVGQQPAGDALGVVQPVDPDEDPDTSVAANGLHLTLDRGIVGQRGERSRVDSHGKDAEADLTLGELHPVDLDRVAQDVGQRDGEVAEVGRGVKADQVGAEDALQQPPAHGQRPEQLLRGKRDMQEETDAGAGEPIAEEARQEEELVVVHPDHVAGPVVRGDDVGERLVRLDVGVPVADLEWNLFQQVVKQGPEHPVREALVEPGDLVGGERHLHEPHGGERLVEARLPLGI